MDTTLEEDGFLALSSGNGWKGPECKGIERVFCINIGVNDNVLHRRNHNIANPHHLKDVSAINAS
jgi:hypothetical protein